MTDEAERRLSALVAQTNELLEHHNNNPAFQFPTWQVLLFVLGVVFTTGGAFYNINQLTAITRQNSAGVKQNEENLVQHIQAELEHELDQKTKALEVLKRSGIKQ